ncbi:kynurenine formamidase [Xanthomonas arboricola]
MSPLLRLATALSLAVSLGSATAATPVPDLQLWQLYQQSLRQAKYIDLTHAFSPTQPVWPGFAPAKFKPAVAGKTLPGFAAQGEQFRYDAHGFVATAYELSTDQYGTQLDPPAHWNPKGATISDLPATYAVRPLVVIDIHEKVEKDPGYHASVADVTAWERTYGPIPEGSVAMFRSDWYKRWNQTQRFAEKPFPGVSLAALKYLHLQRHILFHGHEPLDTDTTDTLEGEQWLLHHNFAQAEGVANLDQVPPSGALIAIGFAKPEGGTGGFARYIAIAPPNWSHGVSVDEVPGAPLAEHAHPLIRDVDGVMREHP